MVNWAFSTVYLVFCYKDQYLIYLLLIIIIIINRIFIQDNLSVPKCTVITRVLSFVILVLSHL